jgi:hypothetical protein
VKIKDFGSLPEGSYPVHNLFFKRRSNMYLTEHSRVARSPYDMATFIDLAAVK